MNNKNQWISAEIKEHKKHLVQLAKAYTESKQYNLKLKINDLKKIS